MSSVAWDRIVRCSSGVLRPVPGLSTAIMRMFWASAGASSHVPSMREPGQPCRKKIVLAVGEGEPNWA